MIRVHLVHLLNWDLQPHQKLVLARGVTLLTGENGSGKTSVLDAIKVALGVTKLDGQRTIAGYLGKQAAPIAMVRLVLDNRAVEGTRRRPLDKLHPSFGDLVTLAVVFRSDGEKHWQQDYYVLDGDVVPIVERAPGRKQGGDAPKPLPGVTVYRQQLKALGVGDQYRKLLELGQGKMARLCDSNGSELFDTLFDIIGGRDTLDEWEARRRELHERHLEKLRVEEDMQAHRNRLEDLAERAERHHRWRKVEAETVALEKALPHVRLATAVRDLEGVRATVSQTNRERERADRSFGAAIDRIAAHDEAVARARQLHAELATAQAEVAENLLEIRQQHLKASNRFAVLDVQRSAGESVPPADLERLVADHEARGVELSAGLRDKADRAAMRVQIDADLDKLAQGLVPWPPDVELFRDALRLAGVPHHLLAEVVEIADPAWTPALEAFFGPLRLAVVVHDAEAFDKAADLARRMRYPHGVLAPDVRGRSPDDDDGLLPLVIVKEPRFKPLVARLLRRLQPGDPTRPYLPPRDGARLAQDGFLLERTVARHGVVDRLYLGREALERRKQDLLAQRQAHADADAVWMRTEAVLREAIRHLETAIRDQRARQDWEKVRDEFGVVRALVETLAGEINELDGRVTLLGGELKTATVEQTAIGKDRDVAVKDRDKSAKDRDAADAQLDELAGKMTEKEAALGRIQAESLPDRDAAVDAVLAESQTVDVLTARITAMRRGAENYSLADRDPLVPQHLARQQEEQQVVERRLAKVHADLDETRKLAEEAHEQYQTTTRRVFKAYFARLAESARDLDFQLEGRLDLRDDLRFACDLRIAVGEKAAVHHDSEELSGGQKAALSMLMAMTAVALDGDGPGFFLVDEPFAASDVSKINELGAFLERTGARYILSMPTSADLAFCGKWLQGTWVCTRSRGGLDARGRGPVLALPVKQMFTAEARDG